MTITLETKIDELNEKIYEFKQKRFEYLDMAERETDDYKKESLYSFCKDLDYMITDLERDVKELAREIF